MTYEFAGAVRMTLSLPWSSFEHMAGTWLVTVTDDEWPVRWEELLGKLISPSIEASRLRLPVAKAGELRAVLESGRSLMGSAANWSGVREVLEGEGIALPIEIL